MNVCRIVILLKNSFVPSLTPLLKGPEGSTPELTLQLVFFDGEVIINNRINHDCPLIIRKRSSLGLLLTPCMGLVILLLLGRALPSLSGCPHYQDQIFNNFIISFGSNTLFVDPITMNILCNIQARSGPLSKQPSK